MVQQQASQSRKLKSPASKLTVPDVLASAAADMRAQRPIRSARLRQIAVGLRKDDLKDAEEQLRIYLSRRPADADALSLMAQVAIYSGRHGEAMSLLQRSLELASDFALARFTYAELLFKLSKFEAALVELNRLLQSDERNPLFLQMKAVILRITGDHEQSIAIFERLATENPDQPEFWIGFGHGLRTMGFADRSIGAYRRAIRCRPSSGLAYWSIANMKTACLGYDDIAAIQELLTQEDIPSGDRIALEFSLGKAHEDFNDFERAYEHFAKANASLRLRASYNSDRLKSRVADNKSLFTRAFFESRQDAGCKAADPIFVVGQPRSGSTLIEQILSSHSAIEGTAELPYIQVLVGHLEEPLDKGASYLNVLAKLEPGAFAALGEEYLESARPHRRLGLPFFIDKRPANFWHVGLIQLILPNAKIIDARRNPAACLTSMFKQYFNKPRPHLTELGRSYRDYVALMAHFESILPGKIHRVIYEDLVLDSEVEMRKLFEYLGLPFEENCLRYHETKRTILTSSSEQVRKPISGDAVDHWRNYEPWLGPLIKQLGSAFTSYPHVPDDLL